MQRSDAILGEILARTYSAQAWQHEKNEIEISPRILCKCQSYSLLCIVHFINATLSIREILILSYGKLNTKMATIIDDFLAKKSGFDFKYFLNQNSVAQEIIEQVIEDFEIFEKAGIDLSTKNSEALNMTITQRLIHLDDIGFLKESMDAVKEILAKKFVDDEEAIQAAADVLVPPLAVAFIADVTKGNKSIDDQIDDLKIELPSCYRRQKKAD